MLIRRLALAGLFLGMLPAMALAQSDETSAAELFVELNTLQDIDDACQMTFVVRNDTGQGVDAVSFEAVIFDTSGGVDRLTLLLLRDLPEGRMRVRQFNLSGLSCEKIGQVLFNGTNSCQVNGAESDICRETLTLGSRVDVELLG